MSISVKSQEVTENHVPIVMRSYRQEKVYGVGGNTIAYDGILYRISVSIVGIKATIIQNNV
jgi:hypothetical protein